MRSEPLVHDEDIADTSAKREFPWFQISIAMIQECNLA